MKEQFWNVAVVRRRAAMLLSAAFTLMLTIPAHSQTYTFSTLAGYAGYGSADGTGSAASFYHPQSVAVDSATNVYVADAYNNTIRKITPAGAVTTPTGVILRTVLFPESAT